MDRRDNRRYSGVMTDITQILLRIKDGTPEAAEQLLPLVYDDLRRAALAKLRNERPDHTLQATALVHEAYLRLVGKEAAPDSWDNRGHFFAAATEAMRRILVERARRKKRVKHGGGWQKVDWTEANVAAALPSEDLLALDEALELLAATDPDLLTPREALALLYDLKAKI